MLRPATPLSILFFAAFALLLLSTLSTPIVKSIPLATYCGVDLGVFGYCKGSDCHGPLIGYSTGMFGPLITARCGIIDVLIQRHVRRSFSNV